jgi:hypothetical protein
MPVTPRPSPSRVEIDTLNASGASAGAFAAHVNNKRDGARRQVSFTNTPEEVMSLVDNKGPHLWPDDTMWKFVDSGDTVQFGGAEGTLDEKVGMMHQLKGMHSRRVGNRQGSPPPKRPRPTRVDSVPSKTTVQNAPALAEKHARIAERVGLLTWEDVCVLVPTLDLGGKGGQPARILTVVELGMMGQHDWAHAFFAKRACLFHMPDVQSAREIICVPDVIEIYPKATFLPLFACAQILSCSNRGISYTWQDKPGSRLLGMNPELPLLKDAMRAVQGGCAYCQEYVQYNAEGTSVGDGTVFKNTFTLLDTTGVYRSEIIMNSTRILDRVEGGPISIEEMETPATYTKQLLALGLSNITVLCPCPRFHRVYVHLTLVPYS